jgi:hypothetical protein
MRKLLKLVAFLTAGGIGAGIALAYGLGVVGRAIDDGSELLGGWHLAE